MSLDDPVSELKGVGSEVAKKLKIIGIETVRDLLTNYPRRYDDYSRLSDISNIKPGVVSIRATINHANGRYVRRGMHITEAIATDNSGSVRLIWFNQPYRAGSIKQNQEYFISGAFELRNQRMSIMNPAIELASEFPLNTARIVPVYRETKGFKSQQIRKLLAQVLSTIEALPETLPNWIVQKQQLISRAEAVKIMHFPQSMQELEQAKRRLGFEEVFELSLASLLNKYEMMQETSLAVEFNQKLAQQFVSHLPFSLTDDQRKVIWQIYLDMQKTQPMDRLVEGDVGSGKTVIAAMTAVMVMKAGFQVAFMAPTELLARQHAETISQLLRPLGFEGSVSLLVGSLSTKQKSLVHEQIKSNKTQFIVGTHALIQDKVDMHTLGMVIVDEQHRFGVQQRKALQAKAGHMPHVLSLTATPIPRSLALTLYGDLDISVVQTKPANRKPIMTKIFPNVRMAEVYKSITEQIRAGRQAFVVCPLITESDSLQLDSVEKVYENLRNNVFKQNKVGLLHGKMKAEEKEATMNQFIDKQIDVLVSTTVIEVGVDVPNATVMAIMNAERFGLAQLHQLRGRVGRSEHQGYCYLVLGADTPTSKRLNALERSNDGFKLAELDLELRGPGAIYGRQQHGQLDLRVAQLTDVALIAAARQTAQEFIDTGENLLQYSQLYERITKLRAITNVN